MTRWKLFLPLGAVLLLLPLLWLGLGQDPYQHNQTNLGAPLPTWQGVDLLSQTPLTTTAWRGQPLVLNVWASWCAVCLSEHAFLRELAATVPLVGINYRDTPAAAKAWLTAHGNVYQAIFDDQAGQLALALGVYGTPETFLFGQDGRLLARHSGQLTADIWRTQFAPHWHAARQGDKP
ncbi:MAG: DsbE family thiol:disulfide interchange protein [Aeromonas sp.]